MSDPILERVNLSLDHASLLLESYSKLLDRNLLDATPELSLEAAAAALDNAPFALMFHNTAADPIFCYGNRTTLKLFEMSFETFTQMPSRLSAEPENREARAALLHRVAERGYIDDYSGIRISATGRRFRILRATVWNLVDENMNVKGQAAMFKDWEYL